MHQLFRTIVLLALVLGMGSSFAQQARVPVVGELWFVDAPMAKPWIDKFREGLHELGYFEGKNVKIVTRYANGDSSRLPALLEELIALPVDVLVISPKAISAAVKATKTVPIVCYALDVAVQEGLISNLARPGGNLTGSYVQDTEVAGKRLELARELIPNLQRVGVLFDSSDRASIVEAEAFRSIADTKISVQTAGFKNRDELEHVIKIFERARVQIVFIADTPLIYVHREEFMRLAGRRFPISAHVKDYAKIGALFTYAPDMQEMLKRTSRHVDKILKGERAGDIPIEQALSFELTLNLKTAKAFDLVIPESVLLRTRETIR